MNSLLYRESTPGSSCFENMMNDLGYAGDRLGARTLS